MKVIIHRGTREIGGSCVELAAEGGRLILDVGMPLVDRDGSPFEFEESGRSVRELVADGILPAIGGFYADEAREINALVLSHAHQDHLGLAHYVHPDIPVYASEGTRALVEVSRVFLPRVLEIPNLRVLPKSKPMQIGPFKVTGLLVDHSAPDALMLLIEVEGKRILYSGDLRAHGRKGVLFEYLLKRPPRDIDCLLLEGTMLGRGEQAQATEGAVEAELIEILRRKTNLGLFFCSSQNVDRLVSAFRAVRRTRSILVIDLYTAYVLRTLRCISAKLPQFDWPEVRVKYWKHHADCLAKAGMVKFLYDAAPAKIEIEEIVARREKILMLAKANRLLQIVPKRLPTLEGLELIWSMWPAYLTGEDPASKFCAEHGLQMRQIHTSGHATVEDLQRLAEAVKPKRVIPIHTFEPARFQQLFDNALLLTDGEVLSL